MPARPRARSIARIDDALRHEAVDKRLQILRLVGECGSISEAARRAGVSYKAAWQAVDTLGNVWCGLGTSGALGSKAEDWDGVTTFETK